MNGSICLYITNNGIVYKIPKSHYLNNKAIPNLANEEVFMIILFYKTINLKTYVLEDVSLNRLKLDNNGVHKITKDEMNFAMHNFLNYAFSTAESLAESNEPIPLPVAPDNIPTSIEKNALYLYIKEKYPTLWPNCSFLIEQNIEATEKRYNDYKYLVREAYKKKLKNELSQK